MKENKIYENKNQKEVIDYLFSLYPEGYWNQEMNIWKQRLSVFLYPLITTLFYLRNNNEIVINDKTILYFLNIDKIEELVHREDIPDKFRNDLNHYLTGILYYAKPKTEKYKEIHDFIIMSLKDILSEK